MAASSKSYFLAPSWSIRPEEVVLGSIVPNPRRPERAISAAGLVESIDTTIPEPLEEKKVSRTAMVTRKWETGLFATFLHVISIGAQASFSSDSIQKVDYSCDVMETRKFAPSQAYIEKAVEDAAVKSYLKTGGFGAKVFMITGVKTAKNITITTTEDMNKKANVKIGVDTYGDMKLGVGPRVTCESSFSGISTRYIEGPIVFAFEIEKMRLNLRGKATHKEHITGAVLGMGDRTMDYFVERAGNELDEDEEVDFCMQAQLGKDDGTKENCRIFTPQMEEI